MRLPPSIVPSPTGKVTEGDPRVSIDKAAMTPEVPKAEAKIDPDLGKDRQAAGSKTQRSHYRAAAMLAVTEYHLATMEKTIAHVEDMTRDVEEIGRRVSQGNGPQTMRNRPAQ